MVKIVDHKTSVNKEGKEFISLKLQGGVTAIQSQQTGGFYLTANTCQIASTFDEETAKTLIGNEIPGRVVRVETEPYEYTIKQTGEVITLTHKFVYMPEETKTQAPVLVYQEPLAVEV